MATIKQITIEYSYTFNLGNYNSVKPTVSLTAELAQGDDPQLVLLDLQDQARLGVQREIDAALEHEGKRPHFGKVNVTAKSSEDDVPF